MGRKGKKNYTKHNNTSTSRGRGLGNAPFIPGRGDGHGYGPDSPTRGRGRGGGYNPRTHVPGSSFTQEEMDFTIHMYADGEDLYFLLILKRTRAGWRGGGRGRGNFNNPPQNGNYQNGGNRGGYGSPHPRGTYTPRGGGSDRGRGRGRGGYFPPPQNEPDFSPRHGRGIGATPDTTPIANKKLGANATLSDLLYASRPLLKPIKFVSSVHAPFLFQYDQEELMRPIGEQIGDGEASHVPTADRIERIFHGDIGAEDSSSSSSSEDDDDDEDEEEVEEVDFNNLGALAAAPPTGKSKATATATKTETKVKVDGVHRMAESQVNTSSYQQTQHETRGAGARIANNSIPVKPATAQDQTRMDVEEGLTHSIQQQPPASFFIDTQPGFVHPALSPRPPMPPPEDDDDEEIIVYVAPHPKVRSVSRLGTHPPPPADKASSAMDIDTSGFEPYSPPAALSLASMSIQDPTPVAHFSPAAADTMDTDMTDRPRSVAPPAHKSSVPPEPTPSSIAAAPPQKIAPNPTIASLKKFDFASTLLASTLSSSSIRKFPNIISPRVAKKQNAWERKKAKRERMKAKKKGRRSTGTRGGGGGGGGLATYGALVDDARLYSEDVLWEENGGKDKKWEKRRRGDSDLDWGTEDGESDSDDDDDSESGVEIAPNGLGKPMSEKAKGKQKAQSEDMDASVDGGKEDDHGMEVDSEIDVEAMKRFVSGLVSRDAGMFTTMDDVEDEKKLREEDAEGWEDDEDEDEDDEDEDDEDEDEDEDGEEEEDEEVKAAIELEEKLLIGESSEDDDDDDDDDDEVDISPKSSFQARLEKLRAKSRENKARDADGGDMLAENMAWAEGTMMMTTMTTTMMILSLVNFRSVLFDILDQHADILDSRNRKERNKLFKAVQNGSFDIDYADMQPAGKRKDKYKNVPPELAAQWELDRKRKAELKHERELKKLIEATDPFTKKKGGKKGRKAMLKGAAADPTINLGPNRIIDMTTLVQQIRRFVDNLDGPRTMSLPPANKETRKNVHEMAAAFGLKSVSKGHGDARYTTLTKTSRTGLGRVDEWKVQKVVRRAGGRGARGDSFGDFDGGRAKGKGRVPRHKEGDEVGGSAPKIGEGNVGFKMLAAMGWEEGDKIGLSGGLETPLVAIIKHSKLGLGATK
ncbi:hypothetical protein D9756_010772 [Leucocoprinus leucothites]|uniref:Protein SQS1 n=1 Tax=Leucocoprinus leucothites TaxID=201217 RepID=A0A8H5CUB4_9AGAR|nr:hypothetical protein D9756_010772 [Leucoagaricus leucothites]